MPKVKSYNVESLILYFMDLRRKGFLQISARHINTFLQDPRLRTTHEPASDIPNAYCARCHYFENCSREKNVWCKDYKRRSS